MSSVRISVFDNAVYTLAKAIDFDGHSTGFITEDEIHDAVKNNPDVIRKMSEALDHRHSYTADVIAGYYHHPTLPFTLYLSQGCEMGYRTNHICGHSTWYLANLDSYRGICGVWLVSREKGWRPERLSDSPSVSFFVIARLHILAARARARVWAPGGLGFQIAKCDFEAQQYIYRYDKHK